MPWYVVQEDNPECMFCSSFSVFNYFAEKPVIALDLTLFTSQAVNPLSGSQTSFGEAERGFGVHKQKHTTCVSFTVFAGKPATCSLIPILFHLTSSGACFSCQSLPRGSPAVLMLMLLWSERLHSSL